MSCAPTSWSFMRLAALGTDAAYFLRGLFTIETVIYAALAAPLYALGLWLGSRVFRGSNDKQYRVAAFVLIAISVVLSLPAVSDWLH